MRPIQSINKWSDHISPLLKIRYAMLQAALADAGYDENRYYGLAPVCNAQDNVETECRKGDWVELYIEALALGIDLDSIPNIQNCEYIPVNDLNPTFSGSFATLTTALTGVNNDLTFTARERGNDGNLINITYVVAGNSTPLTVGIVGNDITVNVATGAGGAATSTATQIRAALIANATINALINTALAAGNTGAGVVTALAKTFLAGGAN